MASDQDKVVVELPRAEVQVILWRLIEPHEAERSRPAYESLLQKLRAALQTGDSADELVRTEDAPSVPDQSEQQDQVEGEPGWTRWEPTFDGIVESDVGEFVMHDAALAALQAERSRREEAERRADEWETAAKETAVQGAANFAWSGEAKGALEAIREITTSDEIEEIVDGLLDGIAEHRVRAEAAERRAEEAERKRDALRDKLIAAAWPIHAMTEEHPDMPEWAREPIQWLEELKAQAQAAEGLAEAVKCAIGNANAYVTGRRAASACRQMVEELLRSALATYSQAIGNEADRDAIGQQEAS